MAVRIPGLRPMNRQMRFGVMESVSLFTTWAYLLGGAKPEDRLFFWKREETEGEVLDFLIGEGDGERGVFAFEEVRFVLVETEVF